MKVRIAAGLVCLGLLLVGNRVGAQARDGGVVSSPLRGTVSPSEAAVRVAHGRVELFGTPKIAGGVTVGVDSFVEVRCGLSVKNALDRPVRDVIVELSLQREAAGDAVPALPAVKSAGPNTAPPVVEDDELHAADPVAAEAISSWTFRYTLDRIEAGAMRALSCKTALPPPPNGSLPSSLAEVVYEAKVVGYGAPGLSLIRAQSLIRGGIETDARMAFADYGGKRSDEDRERDEALLVAFAHLTTDADFEGLNTRLQFAFYLTAARRIGGAATLAAFLVAEDQLIARANRFPEPADDGRPQPLSDLLPRSFPAAVHETLVDLAHRNLASLYRLVPPASSQTGGAVVDPLAIAATRLAQEEELLTPEAWLDAASSLVAAPPLPVANDGVVVVRERPAMLVVAMGERGGREVVPALGRMLTELVAATPDNATAQALSDGESQRAAAARVLAGRGAVGLGFVIDALFVEDELSRKPIARVVAHLPPAQIETLRGLLSTRDVLVGEHAGAEEILAALHAHFVEMRKGQVGELLSLAEQADPLSPQPLSLLAEAKRKSKSHYDAQRERLAVLAARLYTARSATGRSDGRALLDEVHAMGPVAAPAFHEAWRDALLVEARAQAKGNLTHALSVLGEGKPLPGDLTDPVLQSAARSLIMEALDAALDHHDRRRVRALIDTAKRYGVPAHDLEAPERRLREIALRRLLSTVAKWTCAVAAGVFAIAGLVALRQRRRKKAARAA